MANSYFRCKEFIVHQQHTSMKVCTDACLFGAWVAQKQCIEKADTLLDIGTGTGLLSLMMAQVTQNNQTQITAVEIESNAAQQASENFRISNWSDRLNIVHKSLQEYTAQSLKEKNKIVAFDVIISNPPFYEGYLASPDINKNKASHSTHLSWENLVENTSSLLKEEGSFFVLVPTLRAFTMQKLAEQNHLLLVEEVLVYNDVKHLPFRSFLHFQKKKPAVHSLINVHRNKIIIKNEAGVYSTEFTELLKPFYLHL